MRGYCDSARTTEALADCPSCGSVVEVTFDAGTLVEGDRDGIITLDADGYTVVARLPSVGDLDAIPHNLVDEDMRWFLLERCVVDARHHGEPVSGRDLPYDLVADIEEALDDADPAANIQFRVACPECGTEWWDSLDPVRFAWSAVEQAARRLATDVHTLARGLGWSEQDILALSPFRRHLYLSAVEQ
jgi:hypothetical protein